MIDNKVTIIVPVYNTENYLQKCVLSLIEQTYKNLEIILVNDGSTDTSGYICEQLAKMDSRIVFIEQENRGVSAARNSALKKMTGDYLMFLDSDDWLESHCVEKVLSNMLDKYADVLFFNSVFEYSSGWSELRVSNPLQGLVDKRELIRQTFGSYGYFLNVNCKMFRVASLKNKEGELLFFDESAFILEDGVWLIPNLIKFKRGFLDSYGYHHRTMRDDSATGNKDKFRERDCEFVKSYCKIIDILVLHNDDELLQIAKSCCFSMLDSAIGRLLANKNPEGIAELLMSCKEEYRYEFIEKRLRTLHWIKHSKEYKLGSKITKIINRNIIFRFGFRAASIFYRCMKKITRIFRRK